MNDTIVVGLTGGIGSGKSTVARILSAKNIPIYIADDAAKDLYLSDPQLKAQVIAHFGSESYVDGKLNRIHLSEIVFNSKDQLNLLNSLVHPAVARDFHSWKEAHEAHQILVKEAAILFESGSFLTCDYTVTVNCDEALRVQRVMERDLVTKEAVLARIQQQWTDEQRTEKADFTIVNDGSQLLILQIERMLAHINDLFFGSERSG